MRAGFCLLIAPLTACATVFAPVDSPPVGQTLSYVRSNIAGGEEEQVHMHRVSPSEIAVYKMRERCTSAALVTATIDPATGEASRLVAGRLARNAAQRAVGILTFTGDRIDAELTTDDGTMRDSVAISARPWHLYDYDLATLAAATQAMRGPPADFSFGLALVWPGDDPARFLQWLGRADARYIGRERHEGRETLRYDVSGPAFGAEGGGPMWLDAAARYLVDVQWKRPNHPGYDDYRLRLTGATNEGAAGWTRRLTDHFTGCAGQAE